jgi:hypothetical protein
MAEQQEFDAVTLELQEQYGWSDEETREFLKFYEIEKRRKFIEAMQHLTRCRHEVS